MVDGDGEGAKSWQGGALTGVRGGCLQSYWYDGDRGGGGDDLSWGCGGGRWWCLGGGGGGLSWGCGGGRRWCLGGGDVVIGLHNTCEVGGGGGGEGGGGE